MKSAYTILRRFASKEATFKLQPFKLHKLEKGPVTEATLTKEEALHYYTQMYTIRRMEQSCNALYQQKFIRGFLHLYIGQEACCVGMKAGMVEGDKVITAYRDHGWAYVMGLTTKSIICELTGRHSGSQRGRGGSMHLYCKDFYGGNGIVGAQIPVGAGIGLALKLLPKVDPTSEAAKTSNVCIALYGDGAANQGQAFEAYNMSKLWDLPVIFVCENNKYGMGTSAERASANTSYYTRGDYIPGIHVDGMDLLSVREATRFATEYCRAGKGPLMIEVETYRYYGHSMSDPGTSYRTRREIEAIRSSRDCLNNFKKKIIEAGLLSEEELAKVEETAQAEVDAATEASKTDPEPPEDELVTHIYKNPDPNLKVRGCDVTIYKNPI